MLSPAAKERIVKLLGPRGYLDRPEDLALYEYDGGQDRHPPDVVVFPRTAAEVGALVRIANQFGMPIVGRGAGTGLSGGAIPRQGGMMIAFARMNHILNLDTANERAMERFAACPFYVHAGALAAVALVLRYWSAGGNAAFEIGRASCRERGDISAGHV